MRLLLMYSRRIRNNSMNFNLCQLLSIFLGVREQANGRTRNSLSQLSIWRVIYLCSSNNPRGELDLCLCLSLCMSGYSYSLTLSPSLSLCCRANKPYRRKKTMGRQNSSMNYKSACFESLIRSCVLIPQLKQADPGSLIIWFLFELRSNLEPFSFPGKIFHFIRERKRERKKLDEFLSKSILH